MFDDAKKFGLNAGVTVPFRGQAGIVLDNEFCAKRSE
ncbi:MULTISPECIES: autoinducer binding domain-containing protein [Rhizobium]|nr:hypothetical protein [Rhizobium bangladeshense]MBX5139271.1 hypothetical protein [Rhizobium lentis]MBX4918087.1 hypothetical protein [Rhizobium bangladeshense]MBX4921977.1 hypothetical protein [Rhizobium bangladeshense]MBX4935428.1 hypothetical protein [Rhizobium bangladeshense]